MIRAILKRWLHRRSVPLLVRTGTPRDGGVGTLLECRLSTDVGKEGSYRYGVRMAGWAPPVGVWTPEGAA